MRLNFNQCMEWLLEHEGGYVDHPKDPGGATNFGVTLRTWERYVGRAVTKDEIKNLTKADVHDLYHDMYWNAILGDNLPSGLDWSVFDWAVNSGPPRAAKALQRIVGATADGIIGPKTVAATFNYEPEVIIERMYTARQKFYESLDTFDTFGRGWTSRNKHTLQQALSLAGG